MKVKEDWMIMKVQEIEQENPEMENCTNNEEENRKKKIHGVN